MKRNFENSIGRYFDVTATLTLRYRHHVKCWPTSAPLDPQILVWRVLIFIYEIIVLRRLECSYLFCSRCGTNVIGENLLSRVYRSEPTPPWIVIWNVVKRRCYYIWVEFQNWWKWPVCDPQFTPLVISALSSFFVPERAGVVFTTISHEQYIKELNLLPGWIFKKCSSVVAIPKVKKNFWCTLSCCCTLPDVSRRLPVCFNGILMF